MRVVIAPDSFKESMSAADAADAMRRGVLAAVPDAECVLVPMADGGEGTTDALVAALGGTLVTARVTGPMGAPVEASYGWVADERLAIIEVAAAVGLDLVPRDRRDVWHATSRGVGELLTHALDSGAARVIVGLGGSATNDGGAGLLQCLGVRLLDEAGHDVAPGPAGLRSLVATDASGLDPRLRAVDVLVACDVTNPLLGPSGASAVYGPQKGATEQQVPLLDAVLARLAPALDQLAGRPVCEAPGAGAAGGLGAALLACAHAQLRPGVDVVLEAARLPAALAGADLVLTGEGSVDAQSLHGKTPFGVARAAAAQGVPTVVLAGRVGPGAHRLLEHGVSAIVPITRSAMSLDEALATGPANLEQAAATTMRLIGVGARRRAAL
ncbi:glycerate kinase [Xylanimonas ulmi]|uniref:Glycerate kinase n=1 Tax=Xylanimonas ulmi TaxID=228973 RepID=A0A4Q7M0M4_9MICO|nr:glycerate kinase [Xylanibacterium ulmi]RZS60433.1 glycerate kinase [Xylanibacterium ulmi]